MEVDENGLKELKYIFSYMVDAFSYEVDRDKKASEIERLTKCLESDKSSIESIKQELSSIMDNFASTHNDFKSYEEKIIETVSSVTSQFFTKSSQDIFSRISEMNTAIEKDVKNGKEIIGKFFSLNPFTILNSNIELLVNNGAIEIKQFLQFSYGIRCTFLLNTKDSEFMNNPYFSSLYTGVKIPVGIDNSGNITYESLSSYRLESAYITGQTLKCTFKTENSGNFFEFAYDLNRSAIGISYTINNNTLNIVDEPDLKAHLDNDILMDSLDKLNKEIWELTEKSKEIISLKIDDEEVLSTMEFGKIFYRIIESNYIKSLIKSLPETDENPDNISKDFIRHRIHTIGKDEEYILSILFG
ncbi:hypothetical protein [Ferroplasma sp.]|uniref:hypothetical protein n=1 Tax=Ferroplasma sp. TaxID=2591003 RepID=UPI00307F98ED